MTLLCPKIIGTSTDALRFAGLARCPVVALVDDFGAAAQYAALPHHPLVIGRVVVDDEVSPEQMIAQDPVAVAAWDFERRRIAERARLHPDIAAWEGPNEAVCKTRHAMTWYALFEAERVRMLANIRRAAVVGNFSLGQPEPELWPDFAPALDMVRLFGGYLGVHEYSEPSRFWDTHYFGRFTRAPRDVPKIITECGTDGIPPVRDPNTDEIIHPAGAAWHEQFSGNSRAYADFLIAYDLELSRHPDVVGACIYTFGRTSGDDAHGVEGSGLADHLIAWAQAQPPPAPVLARIKPPLRVLFRHPAGDPFALAAAADVTVLSKSGDWYELRAWVHKNAVEEL